MWQGLREQMDVVLDRWNQCPGRVKPVTTIPAPALSRAVLFAVCPSAGLHSREIQILLQKDFKGNVSFPVSVLRKQRAGLPNQAPHLCGFSSRPHLSTLHNPPCPSLWVSLSSSPSHPHLAFSKPRNLRVGVSWVAFKLCEAFIGISKNCGVCWLEGSGFFHPCKSSHNLIYRRKSTGEPGRMEEKVEGEFFSLLCKTEWALGLPKRRGNHCSIRPSRWGETCRVSAFCTSSENTAALPAPPSLWT